MFYKLGVREIALAAITLSLICVSFLVLLALGDHDDMTLQHGGAWRSHHQARGRRERARRREQQRNTMTMQMQMTSRTKLAMIQQ